MIYESVRNAYGEKLIELGKKNKDIVVLDADLAKSTQTIRFGKEFSDRFIDSGLSEQDMISTAAGIALTGKIVFASTFCVFLTGRAYDQIRQSVCYNKANVKLVGSHSGLGVGEDGATHQILEDIALMRALPNMRIIVPADATETSQVIEYVANEYGSFFVRLTRSKQPKIYDENYKFEFGKASVLRDGDDIAIFAIGAMVGRSVDAAEELNSRGIRAAVINASSLKPFDENTLLDYAKKVKGIITVEDHSIYGGLGSTVSEILSQNHPVKMKIIGVNDKFGRSGSPEVLYDYFGLNVKRIVEEGLKLVESD